MILKCILLHFIPGWWKLRMTESKWCFLQKTPSCCIISFSCVKSIQGCTNPPFVLRTFSLTLFICNEFPPPPPSQSLSLSNEIILFKCSNNVSASFLIIARILSAKHTHNLCQYLLLISHHFVPAPTRHSLGNVNYKQICFSLRRIVTF